MTQPTRLLLIAIGGVIAVLLLWQTASRSYFQPRKELLADLKRFSEDRDVYERLLDRSTQLSDDFRRLERRTLGGELETADHRLRTRLNRIAEEIPLSATVATSSPSARRTPASAAFGRGAGLAREMRDMIDFVELGASISGEGTLAQIVHLIDRIEAETWIKRVHDVRINPRAGGERFSFTLRVSTLFIPDTPELAALGLPATNREERWWSPADAGYEPSRLASFATLVDSNPFRIPSAPAAVGHTPAAVPPSFPWQQWFLTGVAEGPHGPEIWLLNRSSGERLVLAPGQRVGEAVFIGIFGGEATSGDEAIFELGQSRFLVSVGGHLDDRTPINH